MPMRRSKFEVERRARRSFSEGWFGVRSSAFKPPSANALCHGVVRRSKLSAVPAVALAKVGSTFGVQFLSPRLPMLYATA